MSERSFQGYGAPPDWDPEVFYPDRMCVIDQGVLWRCLVPNSNSRPAFTNPKWAARTSPALLAVTLQPAQIRTLNSVPVDLVVPATPTTFLAPGQLVFVGKQGTVAYSAAPNPIIQYAGGLKTVFTDQAAWDGSVPACSLVPDVSVAQGASGFDAIGLVGLALQLTSGADVTGGDAPLTIMLRYIPYELAGLL